MLDVLDFTCNPCDLCYIEHAFHWSGGGFCISIKFDNVTHVSLQYISFHRSGGQVSSMFPYVYIMRDGLCGSIKVLSAMFATSSFRCYPGDHGCSGVPFHLQSTCFYYVFYILMLVALTCLLLRVLHITCSTYYPCSHRRGCVSKSCTCFLLLLQVLQCYPHVHCSIYISIDVVAS